MFIPHTQDIFPSHSLCLDSSYLPLQVQVQYYLPVKPSNLPDIAGYCFLRVPYPGFFQHWLFEIPSPQGSEALSGRNHH